MPDAHETLLQHIFSQIAAPHETQGNPVQARAYTAIERFEGTSVAQRSGCQELRQLVTFGD